MSRQQLKNFMEHGSLNSNRQRTYVVCNGKRALRSDEPTDAPFDINIEVHCTDIKQLELQNNKYNIKKQEL